MNRTLLTLNEVKWRKIEDRSHRCKPGHAILDFWREALNLTIDEWDRLPRDSFNVSDHEVTSEDYRRLEAILSIKAKSRADKNAVAFILLDKGPAVSE